MQKINETPREAHGPLPVGLGLILVVLLIGAVQAQETKKSLADVDPDHAAKMAKGLDVFKKHVRPILEQHCLRCHGGKKIEAEFDLSDRESLLKGGEHGPAVVPGKSKESLLIKVVNHQREPHMPKSGDKLPPAALAQLASWIDLGAPYDNPLVATKAKKVAWTERVVPAEARKFWSLEPLQKVTPPAANDAWVKTSIDQFIRVKQKSIGLTPNKPAERHTLIRRAYFDLIGLPPPPSAVESFLNDTSPDAFAKVVDQLLASPHYGERWGRHWLDLARFAESHGFEHDYDRPTAYHYRDFVIEALNRDLPYDQFVKWQIAGDEFEPDNPLALKATGFLAAGVHSTQITKSEVEKHRYDEMDDKLSTLTSAMLGLSVGCARCHDHKYDPIPQRDYYRLLASFTTTVRSEIDLNLDPEGYKKAKAAFDQHHAPFAEALRKYEVDELPQRLARWEKLAMSKQFAWETAEVTQAKAKEGSTLTVQPDGSILAADKNPKFETYTIVANTTLSKIRAIRLEALAQPNLVKGGPGRAANGNFALTDFRVTAKALESTESTKPTPLKLTNARATFEQKGLPIKAAIDDDAKSAWAIDPQFGKDHAAVFDVETPIGFSGGAIVTFTLKFENNDGHNLGLLRLALASEPPPPTLTAPGMPAKVRALLDLPADKRSADQTKTILRWYRTIDADWLKLNQARLQNETMAPKPNTVKALVATEGLPAVRLHTQGEDFFPETYFLRRGDSDNKDGVARQGFLQVLTRSPDAEKLWQTPPPAGARTSYRRRALAEWLTDTEQGAGSLLARVIVNRLWQHHLGRGIVATPSDFGTRGERPTHPELLEYLASELVKNGWRLKAIHKLILTSAVYQQGSEIDEPRTKLDRDNKLCWHFPPKRLEAEVIRDSLLAVSGELDPKQFGPGTLDEKSKRRSIYFTVKRSKLMPMMVIFDAPEALNGTAERPTTTIAPQALHLLNNPQVRDCARSFARRIAPNAETPLEDAVTLGYRIAVARAPSADELRDGVAFIRQQQATYPAAESRAAALADFCQVLMCLNEFVYVD